MYCKNEKSYFIYLKWKVWNSKKWRLKAYLNPIKYFFSIPCITSFRIITNGKIIINETKQQSIQLSNNSYLVLTKTKFHDIALLQFKLQWNSFITNSVIIQRIIYYTNEPCYKEQIWSVPSCSLKPSLTVCYNKAV